MSTGEALFRSSTVDFQVWVAEGGQPFPLRAVLTYKPVPGKPQYHARFSHWNLSPPLTEALFRFRPPAETVKIPFLPQLLALGAEPPQAEGTPGEKP